jgi:hypothetical protein
VGFRSLGLALYDLGGWYAGTSNSTLLQLNSFKEQFGGEVVMEWNSYSSHSTVGWLYLAARDLKLRAATRR